MKPGSWSSYQAALPIEARAGGEPDDDQDPPERRDRKGRIRRRVWDVTVGVETWEDASWPETVTWWDDESGEQRSEVVTMHQRVPAIRWFDGPRAVANRAADRWYRRELRRLGEGRVFLVQHADGEIDRLPMRTIEPSEF